MVVERTCTQLQCQCLAVLRDLLYAYIGFQRVAGRLDVDVSIAVVGAGVCERGHVAPQVDTVIAVVELTAEAERTVYLKRHALRNAQTTWHAEVSRLFASNETIGSVYKTITSNELPDIVNRLGDVSLTAKADGTDADGSLSTQLNCATGSIKLTAAKKQKALRAHVETHKFELGKLLNSDKAGIVSLSLDAQGSSKDNIGVSGSIYDISFNNYTYRNINLKADYINKALNGSATIDDPNLRATVEGLFEHRSPTPHLRVTTDVQTFAPAALNITTKWNGAQFAGTATCDIKGNNINNAEGQIDIADFTMQNADSCYAIRNINVETGFNDGNHFLSLKSDFGTIDLNGHFSYSSIARSLLNLVADKLPTIPGLEKKPLYSTLILTCSSTLLDISIAKFLVLTCQLVLQIAPNLKHSRNILIANMLSKIQRIRLQNGTLHSLYITPISSI
jgi:hypothetical protein